VTINELVDIVEGIAGVALTRNYNLSALQGIRGRNSDNVDSGASGLEPVDHPRGRAAQHLQVDL
jgi:hypothetical protein